MRIGIDLGGTNIAAGAVDCNLNITAKKSVKTNASRGAEAIAADMEALVRSLAAEAGTPVEGVEAVGIGSPGAIAPAQGTVVYSNNLGFNNVPLAKMLEARLNLPVRIANDANCAALGEYRAARNDAASGEEHDPFVLITLGTGVGGGIIIGGEIYDGFNGMGGEAGHMVIEKNGVPCTCGRKGCWEAYASATGLIRLTKNALEQNPESLMKTISEEAGKVSGRTSFLAARRGDEGGNAVVETYLSYVACGAANIINLFQPAVLCFGGGISGEGDYLLERLRPLVEAELYTVGERKTRLELARLGNAAGIIGAALL